VAHPDVVFFSTRPAGDLLVGRDDALIAVHPEYPIFAGTPALVTSTAAGVLPTGSSMGCVTSGLARREVWRVHFQPNVDARSAGVLAFAGGHAVGVSYSDDCIPMSRSGLGGFDFPGGALSFGLEAEDGMWRSGSGQFFALTFFALAREIDDARVFTVDTADASVDIVAACHGTDPTDFMLDLGASMPAPADTEVALLAVGATSCNLAGVGCTPAAGGLFVCPARRLDLARITCGGAPVRTVVIAAPTAEADIDSDPMSNVCEVSGVVVPSDAGAVDLDGGTGVADGGSFDGSIPGRDATVAPADGANLTDARIGPGRDARPRGDSDLGSGGGGPSFQGGGGCMCSAKGDPRSLAWAALLALFIARRRLR
jgi:hypothetical protein